MAVGLAVAPTILAEDEAPGVAPAITREELGRQVYELGEGEGGREITAILSAGSARDGGGTEVPASMIPCASCHGEDGRGRAEGGLSPSDVTWPALTRPYGTRTRTGRDVPPYDERLVKRAVTMGFDSGGRLLHMAMPRYQLTLGEADALVAWLKRLGDVRDPGVGEDRLRLGVVLPPARSLGDVLLQVLEAATARRNAAGGIYNRSLDLVALELVPGQSPQERGAAVADFLVKEQPFALVASYMTEAEAQIAESLSREGVPLVGGLTAWPQLDAPLNPQVFYLSAGWPQQVRALARYAAPLLREDAPAAVIYPDGAPLNGLARELRAEARFQQIQVLAYPPGGLNAPAAARAGQAAGVEGLFFFGTEAETSALLEAVGTADWQPSIFLLGALAGRGVLATPPSLEGRVFAAVPTVADDIVPEGFANYQELRNKYGLPSEHLPSQVAALAAFEVLVEGLERSGRDVSRQKLRDALEGLYKYETGLTPPLTYTPNQRIGSFGAYVATPDPEGRILLGNSRWVPLP